MSKTSVSLLSLIRAMTGAYKYDSCNDEELLARYAETRDKNAFATLIVRHGPLVWGICSRILGNVEDVEDACQVVLMTLANKASKIPIKTVAGWLHQVARQTALDARKAGKGRKKLEQRLKGLAGAEPLRAETSDETHELLHDEVGKLPEKLRAAVVLHFFEGQTQAEVAAVLDVKESTVWGYLARAKAILQKRMTQRGFTFGAAGVATLLTEATTPAALPLGFVAKTIKATEAFQEGKLTGGLAKLAAEVAKHVPSTTPWWKSGWMIAAMCLSGLGAGGVAWQTGCFSIETDRPRGWETVEKPERAETQEAQPPRLDSYGDPLPPGALARLGTVRFRVEQRWAFEPRPVVTPDKKLLLSATDHGPFRCYDLISGKLDHSFQDAQGRTVPFDPSAIVSPDGSLLLQKTQPSGNHGLWNLVAGKFWGITSSRAQLDAIAASPMGDTIAKVEEKFNPNERSTFDLAVWDDKVHAERWRKSCESRRPLQVRYSSDAKILLALFSSDSQKQGGPSKLTVRRWETATGRELPSRTIEQARPDDCTWSCDGDMLAVCPTWGGRVICIWNTAVGKKLHQITFRGTVHMESTALSADGQILAAWVPENQDSPPALELWSTRTGNLIRKWDHPTRHSDMAFSPDGKWLVCITQTHFIQVWDVHSGELVNRLWADRGHQDAVTSLLAFPRGEGFASVTNFGGLIRWAADPAGGTYSVRGLKRSPQKVWLQQVPASALSPNGEFAATADFLDGSLWGKTPRGLPMKFTYPLKVAFSPDNMRLALLGRKRSRFDKHGNHLVEVKVYVFDVATGDTVKELPTGFDKSDDVSDIDAVLAFSPNGKWLAVGGSADRPHAPTNKHGFHIWDLVAGKIVAKKSMEQIFDLVFSQDGRTLAVSSAYQGFPNTVSLLHLQVNDDGRVRIEGGAIWSACPLGSVASSLVLSPDGRVLATKNAPPYGQNAGKSDAVIRVWETASGKERCRFNDQGSSPLCLAFARDGRSLASGHRDSTVLVWDVTGRLHAGKLAFTRFSAGMLASQWDDLASDDARRAGRAVWALAAAGEAAVPFLEKRLLLYKPRARKPLVDLLADLKHDKFAARQEAREQFKNWGHHAEMFLREVLNRRPSPELRESVKDILLAIEQERRSKEEIRTIRVLETLGQMGGRRAGDLLKKLASEDAHDWRTREAQTALAFWNQMHQERHER